MHSISIDSVAILQSLGDRTRLRLLRLLVAHPNEEACLCEFSDSIQEPEYNVSRHLKILRQAGLLSATKEGRWVYHRLVAESAVAPFYELVSAIDDLDAVFREDSKRFRAEINKRTSSRCTKDGPVAINSESKKRMR